MIKKSEFRYYRSNYFPIVETEILTRSQSAFAIYYIIIYYNFYNFTVNSFRTESQFAGLKRVSRDGDSQVCHYVSHSLYSILGGE